MATFKPENIFPAPAIFPGISKALRLKILLDRARGKFGKVDRQGPRDSYHHENAEKYPNVGGGGYGKSHRRDIGRNDDVIVNDKQGYLFQTHSDENKYKDHRAALGDFEERQGPGGYQFEQANKRRETKHIKDFISIVDIDHKPGRDNPKKFYKALVLPFVPEQLNYNPESNFVGIATMGRNNPHYHYTGSEDTLEFTIDWHSSYNHREDVIFNCRWLESLSKGDGFTDVPHRVQLVWGRDNKLFGSDIWLVTNAKYTLSQFVDSYRDNGSKVSVGLLPQQAIQQVTLKRITNRNRLTSEIIGPRTYEDGLGSLAKRGLNNPTTSIPRF